MFFGVVSSVRFPSASNRVAAFPIITSGLAQRIHRGVDQLPDTVASMLDAPHCLARDPREPLH